MPRGFVYILGSNTGTLYTGVTSDLDRRIFEHREGIRSGFASRYGCTRLLHYESYEDIREAIRREKQIKGKTRAKKTAIIATLNPVFRDLAEQWGWQVIGPAHSITEEDARLLKQVKLCGDSSLRSE